MSTIPEQIGILVINQMRLMKKKAEFVPDYELSIQENAEVKNALEKEHDKNWAFLKQVLLSIKL